MDCPRHHGVKGILCDVVSRAKEGFPLGDMIIITGKQKTRFYLVIYLLCLSPLPSI